MAAINFPTRAQLTTLISTNLTPTPNPISAENHRDVENSIVNAIYNGQIGDIKEIACNSTYISDNFDTTGKGRQNKSDGTPAERYGWAICNGQNLTIDKRGNVSIGYDPANYSTLAPNQSLSTTAPPTKQGGETKHTLSVPEMPSHSHDIMFRRDSSSTGDFLTLANTANSDEGSFDTYTGGDTTSSDVTIKNRGGNQAHNNMQPYIVTLFIQRISV